MAIRRCILAAAAGHAAAVTALLDGGAPINQTDQRQWTALTAARERITRKWLACSPVVARKTVFRSVLRRHRTVASATDSATLLPGATPLIYAAWRGNTDLVQQIISRWRRHLGA